MIDLEGLSARAVVVEATDPPAETTRSALPVGCTIDFAYLPAS